jgi:DNA-binding Lrp family transcriptional regulator
MKLLKMLGENARISLSEMGREVGLSTSGIRRRVKQLENSGVIKGYTVIIDPQKSDRGVAAFMSVEVDSHGAGKIARALARHREVCEIHRTTGDQSLILKIRAQDLDSLNKFVEDRLNSYDGVKSVTTIVAMETFKEVPLNL